MNSNAYTIFYALVLGGICALGLTAASNYTQSARDANEAADKAKSVLSVLGVKLEPNTSAEKVMELYAAKIDDASKYAGYNAYKMKGGTSSAIALDIKGSGYMGGIQALLALNPDEQKIVDIVFYKHEETPGLGKEIEKDAFRKQFRNMSYAKNGNQIVIEMVKAQGDNKASNQFDAVTAATFTSIGVEQMLNDIIKKITEGGK